MVLVRHFHNQGFLCSTGNIFDIYAESARRTRTPRGSERGPRFGPQPSPALRLLDLRLGLRLTLTTALAGQGWAREETEPRRTLRAAYGAARPSPAPPSRLCAGSVAAALSSRALCSTPLGRRGDADSRLLGDFSAVGTRVSVLRRARTERRYRTGR